MTAYLQYGKSKESELIHIENSNSGKVELICPFCDCPLIAVKGVKKIHHYRHDGETCRESLDELEPIAGWSQFHLNYSQQTIKKLKEADLSNHNKRSIFYRKLNKSYRDNLFEYGHKPTVELLIIRGELPIDRFNYWMIKSLDDRLERYRSEVKRKNKSLPALQIEAQRQYSIRTATLYFFEFRLSDNTIVHKVGRTTRDINTRLSETTRELSSLLNGLSITSSKVLCKSDGCGQIEKYLIYKYSYCQYKIGYLTEYFIFQKSKDIDNILNAFSKIQVWYERHELILKDLKQEKIAKQELWLLSKRWLYEHKRLEASKKAIADLTDKPNSNFGRPKGTSVTAEDYLKKYEWVVTLLKRGEKQEKIAEKAKVSLSTIKRVKRIVRQTEKTL